MDAAQTLRVVIVGAGFGGLECAMRLAKAPVAITLIDKANHHTFQPLLYQVATATLSPADVAWPIRGVLRRQKNVTSLMVAATGVDPDRRLVKTGAGDVPYDVLVLATGATHHYFGHDEWAPYAPGLKRIEDAIDIRRRVLMAFERAELHDDPNERSRLMTFVVVGAGPTGVEMAGAIAEIARQGLPAEFRRIHTETARVLLLEAGPRILPTYPDDLAEYARVTLEKKGVEVETGTAVTGVSRTGANTSRGPIATATVIWAAGVAASPAAAWLGAERDRAGRAKVGPDLAVPGRPDVFVIGDAAAAFQAEGPPVPGIAPAAKQMGRYVARRIAARARGEPQPGPFRYRHQGDLATIGRNAAVVRLDHLKLTGFVGWLFWSVAHVFFLIGVRNRIAVAFKWAWDYLTYSRGVRLITEPERAEPPALEVPRARAIEPARSA